MSPTPAPRTLPTNIDDVIARLGGIVQDAADTGSRLGYFGALYNRVTIAVRAGIRARAFDDNARMERLDVVFANRYIDAYDRNMRGEAPSLSWQTSFGAAARSDLSVLQHLLLGMNAHINLDLGIAAATVAPGAQLDALHGDFDRINEVLGSVLPTVEAQLRELSPRLERLSGAAHAAHRLDERIGNFSMEKARDAAWRFARRLGSLGDNAALRNIDIAARDAVTAALALKIQEPGPSSELMGGADSAEVAAHIRILARQDAANPLA